MMGHTLEGLDLQKINEASITNIQKEILKHKVICIRNQDLNSECLAKLTSEIGKPVILPEGLRFNNIDIDFPEITRVSNIRPDGSLIENNTSAEYWHSDGDFWQPGDNYIYSVLHAKVLPEKGGQTGFADLSRAYQQLPRYLKEAIEKLCVVVRCADIPDFADAKEDEYQPDAFHRIKHTHRETGAVGLYFGCTASPVEGWSPADSTTLMDVLMTYVETPEKAYSRACGASVYGGGCYNLI